MRWSGDLKCWAITADLALTVLIAACSDTNGSPTNDPSDSGTDGVSGLPADAGVDRGEEGDPSGTSPDGTVDIVADDTMPPSLLRQVADIVIANCAVSGCHDAITKEHDMDLSTSASIHASWVNQRGPDHCQNRALVRVVPGNPNGSYVMTKITATMKPCDLWDPMPPAPRAPLTAAQIETIRAWIQAGARAEAP